jgi:hypothetical protein
VHFNYTENYIDDRVDEWHASNTQCSLNSFLGFTEHEYARYVESNAIPFRYNIIALFKNKYL